MPGQTRGRQVAEASEVLDVASLYRVHVRYLLQLLARGFGARLRLIRPQLMPLGSWDMEVVPSSFALLCLSALTVSSLLLCSPSVLCSLNGTPFGPAV
jgi:hypothetical protein